jgi:general secretion pathway protein M
MMAAMRTAWQGREPRERALLAFGVVFLLAALIYVLVVDPVLAAGRKAESALPHLRREAAEMERLADLAKRLKPQAGQARLTPSAPLLTQSAGKFGLSPQVSPSDDGSFVVQLGRSAMGDVDEWLMTMQADQHLFVREATLASAGAGLVSGRMVLAP